MIAKVRTKTRTRSSKRVCQERLSCRQEGAEARYFCEKCGTFQCRDCDRYIHLNARFLYHVREPVEPPSPDTLCQNPSCVDRNYPDVKCGDCRLNFCFNCNDTVHQAARRDHKRIGLRGPVTKELGDAFCPVIKPLSPVGDNDDSLTYVSLPQEAEADGTMSVAGGTPFDTSSQTLPDICLTEKEASVDLLKESSTSSSLSLSEETDLYGGRKSFKLIDEKENIQVSCEQDLVDKLGCSESTMVKVVSIFGNTGDGKSHTLNHTFFGGREVFTTSAHQASCTIGIWAALDEKNKAIVVDTEGLLGVTSNQNQRTRLLLKILAISDIVIYRTRAERLHNDLFYFLNDASKAYMKHFTEELTAANKRCNINLSLSTLGPVVVLFHETTHTHVFGSDEEPAEILLRERFKELECNIDGFSDLKYVGSQTQVPPTNFSKLRGIIKDQLNNRTIRSPRKPEVVYQALKVLNGKFSGEIEKPVLNTFPDQYFTCTAKCLSCNARCTRSTNHTMDDIPHEADKLKNCQYQHQYENKVYLCKQCYFNGGRNIVVPKTSSSGDNAWLGFAKYVWSGYVLECPNCGIIYRSHQYWYGNKEIEAVVRVEVRHVWPGGHRVLQGTHNAARKILDSIHYVADTVSSVSSKPTRILSDWMTDQIAPTYWIPNCQIKHCAKCEKKFDYNEQKHHCRACGEGYCDQCSANKRPVPERGWGDTPVRVCDKCCHKNQENNGCQSNATESKSPQLTARKVGEVVSSTFGAVASVIDYPLEMLKDTARPAYWVPDEEIRNCIVCKTEFNQKITKHHCRACGQGVCIECSPNKRPVPLRGWDYSVRVCKPCENKTDTL